MESFSYRPLAADENFRLLKVGIASDGQLRCVLEEHFLSDNLSPKMAPPEYTALSYTWGDASFKVPIVCNDQEFVITKNLDEALRASMKMNPYEYIWVDQICINQADNQEKSSQVQRMTLIYHRALTILAWLGPERPDTALAISWIEKVASLTRGFGNDCFRQYEYAEERSRIETYEQLTLDQSISLGVDFSNTAAWSAFSAFYDRPWFSRIWVVQELLPAREARVVCGAHSVDWHAVKSAAAWYTHKASRISADLDPTRRATDGILHADRMNLPWRWSFGFDITRHEATDQVVRATFKWHFPSLLRNFARRAATDPRDKVHALAGLAWTSFTPERDPLLRPDYGKTLREAYRDVIQGFLRAQAEVGHDAESLEFLWDAVLTPFPQAGEAAAPSWLPDWSATPEHEVRGGGLPVEFEGRETNYVYREPPNGDLDLLLLEGVIFGTVAHQSEWSCAAPLVHAIRQSREEFVELYKELCATTRYLHAGGVDDEREDIGTAFAMSITAGTLFKSFAEKGTSEEVYAKNLVEMLETLLLPQATEDENKFRYEKLKPYFELGLPNLGSEWLTSIRRMYCSDRWYITDSGYVGIGNMHMLPGDVIAVVHGLDRACVLRPLGEIEVRDGDGEMLRKFKFVGEAYCRGAKRKLEGTAKDEKGRVTGETFVLA